MSDANAARQNAVNPNAAGHQADPLEQEMGAIARSIRARPAAAAPAVQHDPLRDDILFCEGTGRFILVRYYEDGWIFGQPCNPRGEIDVHERPQLIDERRLAPYSRLGGPR